MKRLVSATLALTLLGGSAAVAAPNDHSGNQDYTGSYGNSYRDDNYRGHDGGGAIVAGVGILALAAILASQHHHYHYGWYNRDRYGYAIGIYRGDADRYGSYDNYNSYGGDYGYQYGGGYGGRFERDGYRR